MRIATMEVPRASPVDDFVPNKTTPSNWSPTWRAFAIAGELGYTIAIPIVLLALGGRFLDRRWGTSPWFILLGVLLAVVVSGIGITRKVRAISK